MQNRVAIIGHSFRFPGTSKQNFWNDLLAQKNLITQVEASRWPQENFLHPDKRHPGTSYTFAAGSIGDIAGFDAAFFGISPREAALMDPQQRILLELAWESFESAGVAPSSLRGSDCGVYIGISSVDYAYRLADDLYALEPTTATGTISSIAANRISYLFDLHGPSIALDTACSSSLVALHQACQAIRSGEVTSALAGGISLHLHPYGFISFSKASMLSKTGQCHVFDASADGYVRSEGGGLVLLKDYQQALSDGDPILAIVAGSAVNTDGNKKGLTIPNPNAQASLMSGVYAQAGIAPEEINYIEAHGTGTAIGDPTETQAIGLALGQKRQAVLLIGSIKSNLGHLESASGIAGLIKAIHCLKHRTIPATIGITHPNPNIKFSEWNLHAITENKPLPAQGRLTIGVNSFGFGGANAHVILQSPPSQRQKERPGTPNSRTDIGLPLMLSGKDGQALQQNALAVKNFMSADLHDSFYDVAYTAFFHRERHPLCALIFADNTEEALIKLTDFSGQSPSTKTGENQSGIYTGNHFADSQGPAFVFAGNGCQWQGMGQALLEQSSIFRQTLVEIDRYFSQYADYSLLEELSGALGDNRYQNTEMAQPALFALQVGLTEVLRDWGIQPAAVVGHSVGEVAAAWASGALSLPEAVQVIYYRSYFQSQTKGLGEMMVVGLGTEAVQALLAQLALQQVVVACINSHHSVTVAGDYKELASLATELQSQRVLHKRLNLDYPFHTPAMEVIEQGIRDSLASIKPTTTGIGFFSTVTGMPLSGDKLDAEYWWHNIRQPVNFQQSIDALINSGINTFIEISAHPILKTYLHDSLKANSVQGLVIPTLTRGQGGIDKLHECCAHTLISGCLDNKPDHKTNTWFPVRGKLADLPHYVWQRENYWHPCTTESYNFLTRKKCHPLLGYPLIQHEQQWENQLDTQLQPFLNDHNIGGTILFPAAGFAEIALAAAHQLHPGAFLAIEELEIRAPLVLSPDISKVIRCTVNRDGRLSLSSRELANSTTWVAHMGGRILSDSSGGRLAIACPTLPTRAPDFDRLSHHLLTSRAGLNYGPAFQTLKHGWRDGRNALAIFEPSESVAYGIGDYYLHPAFLDGAFQLVFQILCDDWLGYEDITFVPVKMGNILLRADHGIPHCAQATVIHRSAHSLNTEFALFDSNSNCLAIFQAVRFRAVRLHHPAPPILHYLDYHLTAAPITAEHTGLTLPPEWRQAYLPDLRENTNTSRYAQEVEPLLDSLCQQFIIEALSSLADATGFLSEAMLIGYYEKNPALSHRLQLALTLAVENLTITTQQGGWQTTPNDPLQELSAQAIWNTLVAEYPEYFYLTHLAGRTGLYLAEIIQGGYQAKAPTINTNLYPSIVQTVFNQTCKQAVNKLLLGQCSELIAQLPVGGRLKILEVSANTPEFASLLGLQLDLTQCDYCFAGLSEQAINAAESQQDHYPTFKTIRLDTPTEIKPTFADGPANFAIVLLNFCNTETLQRLLSQLPQLLTANSPVLLIGLQPAHWIDHVLAITSSQWLSQAQTTQLSDGQWLEQLEGYNFSHCLSHECLPDSQSGIFLLSALSPDLTAPLPAQPLNNWLIMADTDGAEQILAKQLGGLLEHHGQTVIYSEQRWLLPEALENIQHIVHLSGFAQADLSLQTHRCELAGQISKAAAVMASSQVNLWLLTQNVSSLYACDQPQAFADDLLQIAYDAIFWGFGRSLMNETSHCHVRLLDIRGNTDINKTDALAAICRELLADDREQEVFLDPQGKRFVPRLRSRNQLHAPTLAFSGDSGLKIELGFKLPGQLRNLQWQAKANTSLADDRVEVAVKATGLNFRDIMYALGLLADEAVENGYVGASLGLEFAGVITRVGDKAVGFKPGDAVVGMGPASFSNLVHTQTNAIAAMPGHLGFAAAATLPSAFFTVYYALHYLARLQPGEKVLIHGAAGGVGLAAIQIARWLGAEIFATVGSVEKRDFLTLLGIEHIHDSRSLSFAEEILAKTNNQGVDVVLNSLSGEAINRNFQVLKPFGRFLELGKRDFYENTTIGLRPFRNNISYFGIDADQLLQARPELARQLFTEMMALFNSGELQPLPYTVFDAHQVTDAFRHMQQSRQIGKVVVTYDNGIFAKAPITAAKESLHLCPDASYLVTGGLGGFGLRTAQWLVAKGARHLILINRTGTGAEETQSAIRSFALQGVKVLARACDVCDKTALEGLLADCQQLMPAIKGIVHAAAVIEDGLASHCDFGQIQKVLNPKILGAQHLHELTQHMPLDMFVLYSSVATLFGNPGQSRYVAANLWLEALAAFRRQQGLTATCVCWGAIDDVGFLARNEKIKDSLQSRMGGSALNSATALDALEQMLLQNSPTLGISHYDWRILSKYISNSCSPKFNGLASGNTNLDNAKELTPDIKELLNGLSDEGLQARLVDMLKEELSRVLLITKEKIDINQSMYDMGLDSLMGVELVLAIEARFDVQIPVMELGEAATLNKLASRLLTKLRNNSGASESVTTTTDHIHELAKLHSSAISDEQLMALAHAIDAESPVKIISQ